MAALWNGDLSITDRIIAEDFVVHAAPITGVGDGEIHGRDALNQWVGHSADICGDRTVSRP